MNIMRVPQFASVLLIRGYQKTVSPDHGFFRAAFPYGYCKFHPTCSQYAVEALEKYGFVGGWVRALWRIARCNPFTRGGVDRP